DIVFAEADFRIGELFGEPGTGELCTSAFTTELVGDTTAVDGMDDGFTDADILHGGEGVRAAVHPDGVNEHAGDDEGIDTFHLAVTVVDRVEVEGEVDVTNALTVFHLGVFGDELKNESVDGRDGLEIVHT